MSFKDSISSQQKWKIECGKILKEISILIGATFKGKNMLPMGSIFFPLIVAPVKTWFPLCWNILHHSKVDYTCTSILGGVPIYCLLCNWLQNCISQSHILAIFVFSAKKLKTQMCFTVTEIYTEYKILFLSLDFEEHSSRMLNWRSRVTSSRLIGGIELCPWARHNILV